MKKTFLAILIITALAALLNAPAMAGTGYPWKDHAFPYTFLFGNHIDSHQQSKKVDGGQIQGFLYIHYTGETINGIPVAEHTECSADPSSCSAGWTFYGVLAQGRIVSKDEMGMVQFCTSASTLRRLVGYSHFHWLGDPMDDMGLQTGKEYSGYLLKLTATSTFYFRHHGEMILVTPGIDTTSHINVTTCK
jgi:hypothetical protein